jgi:hypothetical protein
MELYVLYKDPAAAGGPGEVKIGVGGEMTRRLDQTQTIDGRSLKLAFHAIFKENQAATEWEQKLNQRLRQSGVKMGSEFFLVNEEMLDGLCEAATQADEYEWLIPLADSERIRLATELSLAKKRVTETFDVWVALPRTTNFDFKIHSYKQYIMRNDMRIRDLKSKHQASGFFNRAVNDKDKLDYTISQLREDTRKRQEKIARLRREFDDSELAYNQWLDATTRVTDLEEALSLLDAG